MATDFYRELGVAKGASTDEIRRAYKKLAVKYHPDRNQGNAEAEVKFKAVNRAHEVLSDEKKRALYDEFGEEGLREGFRADVARAYRSGKAPFGGGSLEDIFAGQGAGGGGFGGFGDLFGDVFRGGAQRGQARGRDAVADVTVDFVAAIQGANIKIKVPGAEDEVTVRVPPGAGDGDKVRVSGRGAPGRGGGPAGDLLLTIRVAEHPHFKREGLDLTLELPISVSEAYLGTKVRVPTPHGDVSLRVPPGAKSGQQVRLREKGVRRQSKTGDLFVKFQIQLPEPGNPSVEKAVAVIGDFTDMSERENIKF